MSFVVEKGGYTLVATTPCNIIAANDQVVSELWFQTPALDKEIVENIISIQLETKSRDQGWVSSPEAGSWSWFDIVVLDSPEAKETKARDGLLLVWLSHTNSLSEKEYKTVTKRRARTKHPIAAQPTNAPHLGPRHRPQNLPDEQKVYLEEVEKQITSLKETVDTYLSDTTPEDAPLAYSSVAKMIPLQGPVRADQLAATKQPPLRLLSFDGGGVRGISSLHILQRIMAKISPNDPNVRPCQYFDMICGTSTGGLIAIMLGRLQMRISECIEAYTSLASDIFAASWWARKKNFSWKGIYYPKENFETALKRLIKERTGNENASMLESGKRNKCKVFVVAGRSQNLSASAEHFRTYRTAFPDPFADTTIWEAARATSAAPTYLPPITIKGVEFVDGGLHFNNPSLLLLLEANAVLGIDKAGFGIVRHLELLLSIGTGMQPNIAIRGLPVNAVGTGLYIKSILDASREIMTDTQRTHNLLQAMLYGNEDKKYFRFNVGSKVGDNWEPMIELDDYQGMPKLVNLTKTYLDGQASRVQALFDAIAKGGGISYKWTTTVAQWVQNPSVVEPRWK
ncbi:hypothetical protein DXG01_012530 [Tephrocybe rancida]|nr:hypothetical protein DXG01_012530 [Tephrocybe rancida]